MQTKVMLTMFSLFAEIERDLISERTKDALAAKKEQGIKLGRPRGKSKLDTREDEIRGMFEMGVKQKAIALKFNCTEATLSHWLKRKRSFLLLEAGWKQPATLKIKKKSSLFFMFKKSTLFKVKKVKIF